MLGAAETLLLARRLLARSVLALGVLALGVLALGVLALGGSALGAPPPVPSLGLDEQQALAAGDVLVRRGASDSEPTLVVVDVAAAPDVAFAAVLDMPARVDDVGSLKAAEVYLDEGQALGVRWTMGMAGLQIVFHTRYEVDQAGHWCTYQLDDSKENGLGSAGGSYQVVATETGSRIVYFAQATPPGGPVPAWLRRQLQEKGSRSLLGGMRDRAEGAD